MVSLRSLDLRSRCVLRRQKADCAKGAQCVVWEWPPRKSEESPGQRRLRAGRRAQMHKFSRLTKIAWHPGVARLRKYQWSRRLSHGTASMFHVCYTYTYARSQLAQTTARRSSEVRKFLAAVRFLARQETPFTSCVSRYLPILLRGAKRLVFAVWSLQSARGQTSPALEVPLWKCHDRLRGKKSPGVNRGETSDPAAASRFSRDR